MKIFDVNSMRAQMKQFELDLEKMPLGKLSKKQIHSAYSVLKELEEVGADLRIKAFSIWWLFSITVKTGVFIFYAFW